MGALDARRHGSAASLATVEYISGPDSLDRFNNLHAVKVFGEPAPGVSSGQAIARIEQVARETLPKNFDVDFAGASFQEKTLGGHFGAWRSGIAVVMVFLILAAQYEKWSLPFSVLMALPFGTFGALAAVYLRGLTNDVYFQIGLVTLLGLAAKNAILIVEYASLKRRRGLFAVGGGDRGGAAAVPADHDDFDGVHPRRRAAGVFDRRRGRRAHLGRHRRHGRHARQRPSSPFSSCRCSSS